MNDPNWRKAAGHGGRLNGMNEIKVPFGRRCWAEVDLSQIVRNYRIYRDSMNPRKEVMCVVKANAYGHGDVKVSLALEKAGCTRSPPSLLICYPSIRLRSVSGSNRCITFAGKVMNILLPYDRL